MTEQAVSGRDTIGRTVEKLYQAFRAPTPSTIEGCPCCIDTRMTDILLSKPLRQIGARDLWRYVTGLFLTIGDVTDFRYFLPRIFELAAAKCGDMPDTEIILGKLKLADWRSWPTSEQDAILEYLDGWLDRAIERDAAGAADGFVGWETEAILCGAARAEIAPERWIGRLLRPSSAPVLADLRERYPDRLSPLLGGRARWFE